ncbi:MAG: NADH-quinone oxidoreductase subunit L [Polyangia bacterium]
MLSRSLLDSVAALRPLRPELLLLLSLYVVALGAARLLAPEPAFRAARRLAGLCCACALASLLVTMSSGGTVLHGPVLLSLGAAGKLTLSLRADVPGGLMLLLVSFLGWVIVGYSQPYLAGDPGRARYLRWLLTTLTTVCLLVLTNNLVVLALAWIGTSLALHQLLAFYRERPQAQLAAHKKFLTSRLGEICLAAAALLLGGALQTLEIDEVLARVRALPALPLELRAAAVLLVLSALIKCAQLPLHGWLMQVMEAPTPVSALLHAGVVNLGGFMLLRLAPLLSASDGARIVLGVVASSSAVVAALIMMTRISVKVMLAWSTCAQMGFMLLQLALGAYDLALLHLLAHSLYKAHAFLSAGGTVEAARLRQMMSPRQPVGLAASLAAAAAGFGTVALAAALWRVRPGEAPALLALGSVLSLALTPLLLSRALRRGGLWPLVTLGSAFGVASLYFGLHHAFSRLLEVPLERDAPAGLIAWVVLCFLALYLVQSLVRARPLSRVARGLYPWFYAGLHLDAWLTRVTLRLWPPRLPAQRERAVSLSVAGRGLP